MRATEPGEVLAETERLVLRRGTPADEPAYHALHDEVVTRAHGWGPDQRVAMVGIFQRRGRFRRRPRAVVLVCDRDDGEVLGALSLGISDRVTTIGVTFGPRGRGRGLAAEALAAYCGVLGSGGFPFICLECSEDNLAMRRVAERCGFEVVASYRHRLPNGVEVAAVRYMRDLEPSSGAP